MRTTNLTQRQPSSPIFAGLAGESPLHVALRIGAATGLALATMLSVAQAEAGDICDSHETISKRLASERDEHPVSLGLSRHGEMLQIFASPGGASWTMVITEPGGQACILDDGRHWLPIEPETRSTAS